MFQVIMMHKCRVNKYLNTNYKIRIRLIITYIPLADLILGVKENSDNLRELDLIKLLFQAQFHLVVLNPITKLGNVTWKKYDNILFCACIM